MTLPSNSHKLHFHLILRMYFIMASPTSVLRFKTFARVFAGFSFIALLFSLNQPILPRTLFGFSTSDMMFYSNITIVVGIFLAGYCYFRYDHGLYELNLSDEDVQKGYEEQSNLPSQYKRDKARKARKMRNRRSK